MTNLRVQRRRERALLVEGVLDDPRWEKLAAGEATPEEIADLKAWARQSKTAQKAWDIFQPPTDAEFEIRSVELVRTLAHREVGQRRNRLQRTNLFGGNPQRGDRRMMAKHQVRQALLDPLDSPNIHERGAPAIPPLPAQEEKWGRNVFIPQDPSPRVSNGRTHMASGSDPVVPIAIEAALGFGDSSGSTSRRLALVRETTNPAPAPMASKRLGRWVHQVKRFSSLQPWFGPLFLCLSFAMFVGIVVWSDGVSRSPIVPTAESVPWPQTRVVSDAFPDSSPERFEASPGIQASFFVPNHASTSATSSTTNASVAPLPKPAARAPQAPASRLSKKAPVEPPENCTGFGVFKRCISP